MLTLDTVSVTIGRRPLVRDVSLAVPGGGWTTVVGPNGAGKSTLLRAVGGLVAFSGSIRACGQSLGGMRPRERARCVASVAQNPVLPPDMTVASYVLLGRTAQLGALGRESRLDRDAVASALDRLDIGELAGRRLATLSGGEAQRATIARALVQEAPVLLLDEPTSSLDIGHGLDVLELVDGLRVERGLSVLSTMHDLTLAGQYAQHLILLDGGAVVAAGAAAEVLTEDNLSRYYRARVRVVREGDSVAVLPVRGAARE